MSGRQSIVFDMDGVLSDFANAFSTLRNRYDQNLAVIHGNQYESWDELAPSTSDANRKAWAFIYDSEWFWRDLKAIPPIEEWRRIVWLGNKHNLYFATNRHGVDPMGQTKLWLYEHGIVSPSVIITKYKGEFCKTVDARYAIDDKSDNASAIAWLSPRTTPCLLDYPFNRYDETKVGSHRVVRVKKLSEFLDLCEQL